MPRVMEGDKRQTIEWWQAQAHKVSGTCLKCRGLTEGAYVPPTLQTQLECAIVERCRLCGWEWVMVKGRINEPMEMLSRPTTHLKPVGTLTTGKRGDHRPAVPGGRRGRGRGNSGLVSKDGV